MIEDKREMFEKIDKKIASTNSSIEHETNMRKKMHAEWQIKTNSV